MKWCREEVDLAADGYLEAILEGGARTGVRGKSCVEMSQAIGVGQAVGFGGRVTHRIEPGSD